MWRRREAPTLRAEDLLWEASVWLESRVTVPIHYVHVEAGFPYARSHGTQWPQVHQPGVNHSLGDTWVPLAAWGHSPLGGSPGSIRLSHRLRANGTDAGDTGPNKWVGGHSGGPCPRREAAALSPGSSSLRPG